jgi:hypothetical protein
LTDDDSGGGVNGLDSMLTFIDGSGTAQVVVSSFNGATGNYLIGADVTAAVTVDELLPDEIRTAGELISGTPIDGTLDGSDRLGAFLVERWALQLDQQEQYTISLASSDFDTYLVVHTPDGRVLTDDDSGGGVNGLDSTLTLTGGSGTAEIVVSSFDGNTGNYRINVNDTRSDGRRNNSK